MSTTGVALREEDCPRCGTSTARHGGAPLEGTLHKRLNRRLWLIVAGVAAAQLLVGWFPLLGSGAVVLAAGAHRFLIVDPASAHLGTRRRLVTRWTIRLLVACFLALTLVVSELCTLIPGVSGGVKAFLAALQVDVMGVVSLRYIAWQVRREREGRPVSTFEWALLAGFLGLLLASVAAFVLVLMWVVQQVGGWLGGLA